MASETHAAKISRRKEVFGFCMFDFANSSYTTLISTVAFSRYFVFAVVGSSNPNRDLYWSLAAAAAHVVMIVISPFLGAMADYSGRKKRFLLWTTVQTVVATALLSTVAPGAIGWGVVLFVLATVGFEAGYIFYNAFLPEVSTPETIGRVSAWSWGTGFIGGLLALIACAPLISRPLIPPGETALDPAAVTAWRWSFVVVAAFFALFSVFTFVYLRERAPRPGTRRTEPYLAMGWRRVSQTFTHLREHREAGKFVLAYLFFYGGIATVIIFAAIYAKDTFKIQEAELLRLFIFTNVAAFPGTLIAGYLADWLGAKRALVITLVGWSLLLVWGSQTGSIRGFWVLAMGIAIGVGATQAIGRAFMALLCPADRRSEFFGYYMMAGRFGAVLAIPLFGLISSATGDQRLAVLWLVPLFVIGLGFVLRVREPRVS
jgi:UMF1 family MFS transporter